MGGYDVRIFASRFPSELAGMALVDSTHPDLANRLPELRSGLATWRRQLRRQELLMPFGVPRKLGWCGNAPPEIQAKLRTIECNVARLREASSECYSMWDESAAQPRTGPLGVLPLIVISEDPKHVPVALAPFEGQQSLASLSSNSVRMTATGSGRQVQRERPDTVILAIRRLLEQNTHSLSTISNDRSLSGECLIDALSRRVKILKNGVARLTRRDDVSAAKSSRLQLCRARWIAAAREDRRELCMARRRAGTGARLLRD
jgi:hypothetical protein